MNQSTNIKEIQGRIRTNPKFKLNELIKSYYFYELSIEFDICQLKMLSQNITNSEIVIISKYQDMFFIISYYNTVIVIKKSLLHKIANFFSSKKELKLYFLPDTKDIFNQQMQNTNYSNKTQIECDKSIDEEINSFNL